MKMSDVELNLPSDNELQTVSECADTYKHIKRQKKNPRRIQTPKEELKYRAKKADNILKTEKPVCTSCGKNLQQYLKSASIFEHPILGVLLCKVCADFYGEGEFSVDEDGTDKYCRWCGQGGTLYLCSECNFGFCRSCIKRNLQRSILKEVDDDDWKCFACKPYPLWDLRALCSASLKDTEKKTKIDKKINKRKIISSCDSGEEQVGEKSSKHVEKNNDSSLGKGKRKRHSHSSEGESLEKKRKHVSEEKDQKKMLYSKSKDKKTTLPSKSAESLVSKCKKYMGDIRQVLDSISDEINKILEDELVVENLSKYSGRKSLLKKTQSLKGMSCRSIEEGFENFFLAYRSTFSMCSLDENIEACSVDVTLAGDIDKIPESLDNPVQKEISNECDTGCGADDTFETDTPKKGFESSEEISSEDRKSDSTDNKVNHNEIVNESSKIDIADRELVNKGEQKISEETTETNGGGSEISGDHEHRNSKNGTNTKVSEMDSKKNSVDDDRDDTDLEDSNSNRNKTTDQENVDLKREDESRTCNEKDLDSENLMMKEGSTDEQKNEGTGEKKKKLENQETGRKKQQSTDVLSGEEVISDSGSEHKLTTESSLAEIKQQKNGLNMSKDSSNDVSDSSNLVDFDTARSLVSSRDKLNDNVSKTKAKNNTKDMSKIEHSNYSNDLDDCSGITPSEKKKFSVSSDDAGDKCDSENENPKIPTVSKNIACKSLKEINEGDSLNKEVNEKDSSECKTVSNLTDSENIVKSKKPIENANSSEKEKVNDIDSKIALLKVLISSSSEDEMSSREEENDVKRESDEPKEKSGPLSSKSLHYQDLHRKEKQKINIYSDTSSDTDQNSSSRGEDKNDTQTVAKMDDLPTCEIVVEKLSEEIFDKYAVSSCSSSGSKYKKSETEDIKKLINLKNVETVPKKKLPSVDSDTESDEEKVNKKKVFRKCKKDTMKKKETLKDFYDKNEVSSEPENSNSSDQEDKCGGLKNILEDLMKKRNDLAKELLLRNSSSDSDELFPTLTKEKKKDSIVDKGRVKKEEKDCDKKEEESDDLYVKEKKRWRRDKLLCMKVSETDTSEEEKKWEAKKEREKKKEQKESDSKGTQNIKKSRIIARNRKLLNSESDSDEIKISSSSESSDKEDSDDFKPFNKRKRKVTDSDKSVKETSGSESDLSVKKTPKRRRIRKPLPDSDDSDDNELKSSQKSENTPNKGRKNIKRILKDKDVAEATQLAAKEEEERRKRIAEKQKLYNAMFNTAVSKAQVLDKLVLDFDPDTKEELIQVDKKLVTKLKPHQVEGVKFMWDACFESLEQAQKSEGSGCILAHCMGLGKTLQVVTLTHTVLTHPKTKVRKVLVVCPLSTVLNWVNEFSKWLDQTDDDIEVLELTKYKKMYERVGVLKHWHENGGVLILAYNLFRILTNPNMKRIKKTNLNILQTSLVDPGPDLVVCDEGHLLKNEKNALSKAMNCLKTRRRIVLTGTPLQNNLLEYHCMVQFVKPNLLGTRKEFANRFVSPITNGQFENSTAHDVKIMKRRAHVLHKMLDSSVQRYDYSVLTPFLPPKFEYVLLVKLTETQIKLYKYFLENLSFISEDGKKTRTARLFSDFQALQRIWTHPRVLVMNAKRMEKKQLLTEEDSEGSLKDFVVSSSEESSLSSSSSSIEDHNVKQKGKKQSKRITRSKTDDGDSDGNETLSVISLESEAKNREENSAAWWQQFVTDSMLEDIQQSGKISLLFKILEECEKIGDKVLVFSQSLLSLDLIEYFLEKMDEQCSEDDGGENPKQKMSWVLGLDYFRLDGSSNPENRSVWCSNFNREDNYRARLFLISTRAGGLGINLVAANRVIIFDASWNPSHDVQSIFRVYRFGQKKPCYIYRFLAMHTMEEKIYNRQVAKLSLACRVVDEQQIERHYSMDDLQELYNFNPEERTAKETPLVPKDILLAELVKGEDSWIESYHEHDTLLENKEEEELNEEERKAAWEDYEKEKQGIRNVASIFDNAAAAAYLNNLGYSEEQIRERVIKENPNWSPFQVQFHVNRVAQQILDYVYGKAYTNESYKKTQMQYNMPLQQSSQQPIYYREPQILPGLLTQQHTSQVHNPLLLEKARESFSRIPIQQVQHSPSMVTANIAPTNTAISSNSTSTDSSQAKIKVKSFGHMINSKFGNNPGIYTNPFSKPSGSGVVKNLSQSNVGATTGYAGQKQLEKSTSNSAVNDIIDIE